MANLRLKKIRPPIHEEIAELQRKLQLLEGEKAAQYESAQSIIQQNREKILQLRQQNKLLHRKLAEVHAADEQVIRDAFQSRMSEKAAYKNMSSKEAVQILDQKVCDKVKKLNALKHVTNTKQQILEQLKIDYNTLRATRPGPLTDGVAAQTNLRMLENQLEKARLKCQEAEYITKSYHKIKEHLQEESLTFQSQLDELECEIIRQKQELRDLQLMNKNAHQAKEEAKAELQHQVSMVYSERRETELVLNRYKRQAEEQKAQTGRGDRRRVALHTDELSSEAQRSGTEGENDRTISSYEEAFTRIKEATGITDIQEVVDRFISQRDTRTRLEEMKAQKELEVQRLKEERDALHAQYENMKYSGESRQCEGRKMLEKHRLQLQNVRERRDAAKENVEKLTHTLNNVSNAVENLYDKLQHITLKDGTVHRESSVSVLDMLQVMGLKLMQLLEEVKGHDIHTLTKEMEEQEFNASIEGKLPDSNTRITLPDDQKANLPEDDDDSEDNDGDVISWAALKKQSQLIVETMMKRKRKNKL